MYFNNRFTVSSYGGPSTTLPSRRKPFHRHSASDISVDESIEPVSLSVNYIPSKLSEFRTGKDDNELNLPKPFSFREKKRQKWNRFKWILFGTNSLLTLLSMIAFIFCLLAWCDVWEKADVIRTANAPELILSTLAASIALLTSLIGWAGILLNNRCFLAWYTFLTWITFALLVTPGYVTYKRLTFNLEGKINAQWSRNLNTLDRLRIQNQLSCCGYFSPYVEATISQTCYARSILPGCKGPYLAYERGLLRHWFEAVFGLVPVHMLIMVAGLLCSNHITNRFGKGMMPEAYQLNMHSMAVIMNNYESQLANLYGPDIANYILDRHRLKTLHDIPSPSSRVDRYYFQDDLSLYDDSIGTPSSLVSRYYFQDDISLYDRSIGRPSSQISSRYSQDDMSLHGRSKARISSYYFQDDMSLHEHSRPWSGTRSSRISSVYSQHDSSSSAYKP